MFSDNLNHEDLPGKLATVTSLLLQVADNSSLGHGSYSLARQEQS